MLAHATDLHEERPAYAHKLHPEKEQRTLTFESDGHPQKREFSSWGMEVISAWCTDKSPLSWVEVKNGDVYHHVPAGAIVTVIVSL